MVEALGIIIDRRPKGRPRKNGKLNHRKNRMCPYFTDDNECVNGKTQRK